MEKILSQPLSKSADATIVAVVNCLPWVVVPELAHGAVIARSLSTAHFASLRRGLRSVAQHTQHIFGFCSWENMVFHFIMAQPASVPTPARAALHFNLAFVMFAAKLKWFCFGRCIISIGFRSIRRRIRKKKIRLGEVVIFGLLLDRIS
jgi:hypothetical protein